LENQKSQDQPAGKLSNEALIQTEWTTIGELQKMISNQALNVKEKTAVANVLAFHVITLNKLLNQRGEKELDEQNLGEYLRCVQPRVVRHFRRDLRVWKRTLTSRR
jgi:hypothetical protein